MENNGQWPDTMSREGEMSKKIAVEVNTTCEIELIGRWNNQNPDLEFDAAGFIEMDFLLRFIWEISAQREMHQEAYHAHRNQTALFTPQSQK